MKLEVVRMTSVEDMNQNDLTYFRRTSRKVSKLSRLKAAGSPERQSQVKADVLVAEWGNKRSLA